MKKCLCLLLACLLLSAVFTGCDKLIVMLDTETLDAFESELDIFSEIESELDDFSDIEEGTDPANDALSRLSVDWQGEEFVILGREDYQPEELTTQDYSDLDFAVYQRNLDFEKHCNLKLNVVLTSTDKISQMVTTDTKTGAGEYDLVHHRLANVITLASEGMLTSFTALDSMDLSAPWWDQGTANLVICDNIYFMNGAINYSDDNNTFVMFFDKQLAGDRGIDPYSLVYDDKWTQDTFQSLIRDVTVDITGNGILDEDDLYGFVATYQTANTLFYGSGLQYVVCRQGQEPTFAMDPDNLNKATNLLDTILGAFYGNQSTYVSPLGKEDRGLSCFREGRSLFFSEIAQYAVGLRRDKNTDFGILPIPKYDESQKEYMTWTNATCSTTCIPGVVMNPDKLGATLEALAILSDQRVVPAYYDVLLRYGSAYDEQSGDMLSRLFMNRCYDVGMYYLDCGDTFASCVQKQMNNFASQYSKKEREAKKSLVSLIEKFEKNN